MSLTASQIDVRKVVTFTATAETPQQISPIGKSLVNSDVKVYGISATGVSTLLTSWTINSTRDILTLNYTAPYTYVLIITNPAVYQGLSYTRDSSFLPTLLENQLDRLTGSIAWIKDRLNHVLRFPETEQDPEVSPIPSISDRASTTLGFAANGDLRVIKDDVYVQQLSESIISTVSADLDEAVAATQSAQAIAEAEATNSSNFADASEVSRLAAEDTLTSLGATLSAAQAAETAAAASAAEAAGYAAETVTYELSLTSGSPQTFPLPTGVANGHRVVIVDVQGKAGTNNITITSAGSVYIGIASHQSVVLASDYTSLELIFYNNRWIALGGNILFI